MIQNYQKPQLTIRQDLQSITPALVRDRNACILGPQFDLFRYTNAVERAVLVGALFVENTNPDPAARQVVPYEGLLSKHIVDADFVKLFAENIEGQLWAANSPAANDTSSTFPYEFKLLSLATPNKIHVIQRGARLTAAFEGYSGQITGATVNYAGSGYAVSSTVDVNVPTVGPGSGAVLRMATDSNGTVTSVAVVSPGTGYKANVTFDAPPSTTGANIGLADGTLIPELYGRPIKAGDVVYTTFNSIQSRRTVKSVEKETLPSTFGGDSTKTNKAFTASTLEPARSETAAFTTPSAPTGWQVMLSRSTIHKITVTNGGTSYTTAPAVTIAAPAVIHGALDWSNAGSQLQATAEAVVVAGVVTAVNVDLPGGSYLNGGVVNVQLNNQGSGYTSAPTIVASASPSGNSAVIKAVIEGGIISKCSIVDPGSGYTTPPTLTVSGGGGTGGALAAIINNGVQSITVSSAGSGYTDGTYDLTFASAPSGGDKAVGTVTFLGGVAVSTNITQSGSGHTSAPAISLSGAGSGSGFVAVAVLGTLPAINIAGVGTGATATAVVVSTASEWSGVVEGASYNGLYGDLYTLTVIKSGITIDDSRVRIRSASGSFSSDNATARHDGYGYVINSPELGGVGIELRAGAITVPLNVGDQFTFVVTGQYKPLDLTSGGQLSAITTVNTGSGYTNGASVSLVISAPPAGGVQAAATVTISGGAVTAYTITNPGSGYLVAPRLVVPNSGDGAALLNGTLTAPEVSRDVTLLQASVYTGTVDTRYKLTVVKGVTDTNANPFTGALIRVTDTAGADAIQNYTLVQGQTYNLGTRGLRFVVPAKSAAALATATASLTSTTVTSIAVTSGGFGYSNTISDPNYPVVTVARGSVDDTTGTGAVVTPVVVNGTIISISVTTVGTGYTVTPVVVISAPKTYQAGIRTGSVYYVDAVAQQQSGTTSVIVLAGQAADVSSWTDLDASINRFNIDVRALYTGVIEPKRNTAPDLAYEVGDNAAGGILLKDTLALEITDRDTDHTWVPVKNATKGRLFAHWRGLVPAVSSDRIKLRNDEDVITTDFGIFDTDNPLCYGSIIALRGSQGKAVYSGKLATNDLAGYTTLLRQAERIDGIFSMAVMTYDADTKTLLKTHVLKVSALDWKLWRRAYQGALNPGSFGLITLDANDAAFQATVISNGSGNRRVLCETGNFLTIGVRAGDLFRTNFRFNEWDEADYDEYVVADVPENDEITLVAGPSAPINPASKFEVWRPDTGLSQCEFIGDSSANINTRRVLNVWSDSPTKNDVNGVAQPVALYYVAAEIAGLRAAVLPQQGLTYTELQHSVDAAPLMYTKYSQEELNVAAAKGTFIVVQDTEDSPVYIRHQLTTDSSNGSLYYEDSVGANLDAISYAVKDIQQPYIGKRNATAESVEELQTKMRTLFHDLQTSPVGFSNIGPAVLAASNLSVAIDSVFKDRINTSVLLELPLPINSIVTVLAATTLQNEVIASNTATVI